MNNEQRRVKSEQRKVNSEERIVYASLILFLKKTEV